MSARYLIGVDLGTTKTKVGLFDLEGRLVQLLQGEYPLHTNGGPGSAEQDARDWWREICRMLQHIARDADMGEVAALCVGGQGPTVVFADENGEPLCNAVLWMDTRVAAEQELLSERLGEPVSPYAHAPRVMWLAAAHPAAYRQARWCLTAFDYVAFRLSGCAVASYYGDHHPFPPEHMAAARLRPELAPPPVKIGDPIGVVSAAAGAETGVPAGVLVVAGVHDGISTLVGAGLTRVGRAADAGGMAGGFALCWDKPLQAQGAFTWPGILPGQTILGGSMTALGKAVDWYLATFEDSAVTHDDLIARAARIRPGADALLFLPYLAGERSPIWDAQARGVFFGLSLRHTRDHLARALLESTAFAVRHLVEPIRAAGVRVDEMRVTGGQAQNDTLSQMKADVLGFPVAVPQVTEAALLGAAALAGVGAGVFADVGSGSENMVQIRRVLEPDMNNHALYSQQFTVYKRLYADLKEAFHELAELRRL